MIQHITIPGFLVLLFVAASLSVPAQDLSQETKKDIVRKLLESLETKDPKPLRFINSKKYIQHNLEIEDGLDGLKKMISRLPANTKANVVRIFADGDYVIAHSELNALVDRVAIDVFRFENGKIVEHWGNLEEKCPNLNFSGRSQLDGPTEVTDADKTETNKALVKEYFETVVLGGKGDQIAKYRSMDNFHQHNCQGEDNKSGGQVTRGSSQNPSVTVKFDVDPKAAAAQRKLAFADAAKNGYLVALDHVYSPGIGHVQKEGDHFRWIPVPYINDSPKAR